MWLEHSPTLLSDLLLLLLLQHTVKESVPPPRQTNSSLLRPKDKRLIRDKGFEQSSSRFTVHYDGRSMPRLTWLYISWGFMECVREDWCEHCAQGMTRAHTHTHLGKWWNDGRRCPMGPTHKSVCLLTHFQSNAGVGRPCFTAICSLTSMHTGTQCHHRASLTKTQFWFCVNQKSVLPAETI